MKIIISPAKLMEFNELYNKISSNIIFNKESSYLLNLLSQYSENDLKKIYKCNDKIAKINFERFKNIKPDLLCNPIYSFNGIQYKNLNVYSLNHDDLMYLQNNLFILSALYGCLRPFDKFNLYRLDLENKVKIDNYKNLYDFWNSKVYNYISSTTDIVINLASIEYSKLITSYSSNNLKVITCHFGKIFENKFIEKSTIAKIGRGLLVRYMALNKIDNVDNLKKFDLNGFVFYEKISNKDNLYFIKKDSN